MKTFTYQHPSFHAPIQHQIVELQNVQVDGSHITVAFTDRKNRKLHIQTNMPYVLRDEVDLDARPTLEVEDEPATISGTIVHD